MIRLQIKGAFVGKQRPRVVKINGRTMSYTPQKTVTYENLIKIIYQSKCFPNLKDKAFGMQIDIYYQIPKSYSKKKREQCLSGLIKPTKKPDDDNIVKTISDALNGLAYYDDCQRVELITTKNWTQDAPYIEFIIYEIKHKCQTIKEKYGEYYEA